MPLVFRADAQKVIIGDGKFDSRRRFLRVVDSDQDAFFSRGPTFAWVEKSSRSWNISWRFRSGPRDVSYKSLTELPVPALADTSIRLKF